VKPDAAHIFKAIEAHKSDTKRLRDLAICRLLLELGLRRNEIVALNVGDFANGALTLHCKRLHGVHRLPQTLTDAIRQWLTVRGPGTPEEPMFIPLDPVAEKEKRKTRLTGVGINKMVSAYGRPNGVFTSPRKLRQSGTVDRKQDVTFRY